tara:strand:+ start:1637 stop:1849 length:213 start_codon:yes stop_codon:yes gene_type:complete
MEIIAQRNFTYQGVKFLLGDELSISHSIITVLRRNAGVNNYTEIFPIITQVGTYCPSDNEILRVLKELND